VQAAGENGNYKTIGTRLRNAYGKALKNSCKFLIRAGFTTVSGYKNFQAALKNKLSQSTITKKPSAGQGAC
jgi:hypothetical protein